MARRVRPPAEWGATRSNWSTSTHAAELRMTIVKNAAHAENQAASSSTCKRQPRAVAMFTRASRENREMQSCAKPLMRGWVTPQCLAASTCIQPLSSMIALISGIRSERTRRFTASCRCVRDCVPNNGVGLHLLFRFGSPQVHELLPDLAFAEPTAIAIRDARRAAAAAPCGLPVCPAPHPCRKGASASPRARSLGTRARRSSICATY